MHQFICKYVDGKIVPLQANKSALLQKVLNSYKDLDMKFKLTIEVIEKNVNEQQQSLYRAYILKASEHFGVHFSEMEKMLFSYFPTDFFNGKLLAKPISKWTSKELDDFINKSSALLAEHGFKF
jgi:hypothetical protein